MMETHLGLRPEEMITLFNRMYLEVWEKTKGNVNWELANISEQINKGEEVDISRLLLEVLEVVITATRDGFVVTMYENNEKIYDDLCQASQRSQGIEEIEEIDEKGTGLPLDDMEDNQEEMKGPIDIPNV
ncbi:MAG: hypothetical protein K8T10_00630 [Candidatus Eremiobacteraeota bacterium]|nr:hypothetical protein [Candidatus Eremiobacteraeota bacterium]